MKIWLCPVKKRSWDIIKRNEIFGVSSFGEKILRKTKPNDLLVFYILSPMNKIIALCRVNSLPIKDATDLWGLGRYPHRIKIQMIKEFRRSIPLSQLLGRRNQGDFEIIPYFRGVEMIELKLNMNNKIIKSIEKNPNISDALLKILST